ncbi:hypothetical protein MARCHEWKA_05050 [Brevundimonas phage vB_BpoS-Marchewka]|uniref:Uncharacterized protein n=1 Tax=Brevundimonas phage vB_BpoS-Marchewka TaxID=2948604 RepID=A0A9E7SU34_9CAUD|nr:hypothetical protein MARCHEWKA_05050 [Brevundimonas phage vB_BpoS-Marchewka]
MAPGFYVVRMPKNGAGSRLIVESRPFQKIAWIETQEPGWARRQAELWCDFVQSQHPKDDVFVIERKGPEIEAARDE